MSGGGVGRVVGDTVVVADASVGGSVVVVDTTTATVGGIVMVSSVEDGVTTSAWIMRCSSFSSAGCWIVVVVARNSVVVGVSDRARGGGTTL